MEERNLVGVCHLDVIHVDDVETMPDELAGNLVGDVVPKEGKAWSRIYLDDDGGLFVERWRMVQGSQLSDATMSGAIAKHKLALMPHLWSLKGGRYLVRLELRNGEPLLMGRIETGATAQVPEVTAGATIGTDRNEARIVFSLSRRYPVPFYNGTVPDPVTPGECPTVGDLLPPMAWAEIAGYLDAGQLDDAIAALMAARTWAELEVLLSPEQLTAAEAAICETCATLEELMIPRTWEELEALLTTAQRYAARVTINLRDTTPATIASYMAAAGSVSNLTAPDGTIKTTDGVTTVGTVKSNGSANLPQSKIKYTTAAGGSAELAASNTEYASSTLRPATTIPRITIYKNDGSTVHSYKDISTPSYTRDESLKLSFEFAAGDDTSLLYTVRSSATGAYLSLSQDGSSGTITVSKNGGSFVAFNLLNYTAINVGDTIQVKRTSYGSAGYVELNGIQP